MQSTDNSNESTNWIEEVISNKHIKSYECKYFSKFQEIGSGSLGTVYRANWKNSELYLTLKSFNLDNTVVKELVREVITKIIYIFCSISVKLTI